jgi:hypothetical protein
MTREKDEGEGRERLDNSQGDKPSRGISNPNSAKDNKPSSKPFLRQGAIKGHQARTATPNNANDPRRSGIVG